MKQNMESNAMLPPLVSVIIPVYNNAEYLNNCFESVLNQTYENYEVIVVDDYSTDEKVKIILDKYKNKNNFYIYFNESNVGICETTNSALKYANGQWFAFLDCDDWLENEAIKKMMDTLTLHPGTVFGYSNRYNYNNVTGEKEEVDFSCRPTKDYYKNLQQGMYTSHLKLIHKSVFARIGLFDKTFNGTQDYDISLRAAFYLGDEAFAFLREPVYNHRIHVTQTTQKMGRFMESETEKLQQIAKTREDISNGIFKRKVSFIILSFNKKIQTLECLESIRQTVKIPYEVILFDNHSTKETIDFIKNHIEPMQKVRVIYSPVNLGPGAGRTEAIKYATGDYFIFLDNDIVVLENWLPELLIRIESDENVAAVNCKVLFPDDTVNFNALKYKLDPPFIQFKLLGFGMKQDDLRTCDFEENDWIPAGATLYKADIYKRLEGLGEYPNTYEDNEAGIQLKKLGYKLLNSPASIVLHNHYQYNIRRVEKEYLEARYSNDNLVRSSLVFYRRNHLIVKDDFILKKMGVLGKANEEIVKEFEKRIWRPKVSIIIPIYNSSRFLDQCLESIVKQSLKDLEIICVNDGSTDDSIMVVNKYAEKDSRIIIIDKNNTGYGHSVNQGIIRASGEYIGIIESDDFAELNMFEKLYEKASKHNVDVIKSNFYEYKTTPKIVNNYVETLKPYGYDTVFKPENKQELFFTHSAVWSSIYKRDFLLKNDIWFTETPGASYQDTAFAFKVWTCADRVVLTKEAFVHYRTDNSESSVVSSKKVYCVYKEFKEIEEFLRLRPDKQQRLISTEVQVKFKIYKWNYARIALEYQYAFLEKAVQDLKMDRKNGRIIQEDWNRESWIELQQMLDNTEEYYYMTKKEKNESAWKVWRSTNNRDVYLKGFYNTLQIYSKIIIYGAGIIGKRTREKLESKGIEILCFAVSEMPKTYEKIGQIKVQCIRDLQDYNQAAMIVVATKPDFHLDILEILRELKFENIIVIDEWLSEALKNS